MKTMKLKFLTSRTLLLRTGDRGNLVSHTYLPVALLPASLLCSFQHQLSLPLLLCLSLQNVTSFNLIYFVFAFKWILDVLLQDRQKKTVSWEFYFHERSVSVCVLGHPFSTTSLGIFEELCQNTLWGCEINWKLKNFHIKPNFRLYSHSHKSKPFKMERRGRDGGGGGERGLLLKMFVKLRF